MDLDEDELSGLIQDIMVKSEGKIVTIIPVPNYDCELIDKLWVKFRVTNEYCLQKNPIVSKELMERNDPTFEFDKDLEMMAFQIFVDFIEGDYNLLMVASSKRDDGVFLLLKNDNFTVLEAENSFYDILADEMLKNNFDPTLSTIGIFLF